MKTRSTISNQHHAFQYYYHEIEQFQLSEADHQKRVNYLQEAQTQFNNARSVKQKDACIALLMNFIELKKAKKLPFSADPFTNDYLELSHWAAQSAQSPYVHERDIAKALQTLIDGVKTEYDVLSPAHHSYTKNKKTLEEVLSRTKMLLDNPSIDNMVAYTKYANNITRQRCHVGIGLGMMAISSGLIILLSLIASNTLLIAIPAVGVIFLPVTVAFFLASTIATFVGSINPLMDKISIKMKDLSSDFDEDSYKISQEFSYKAQSFFGGYSKMEEVADLQSDIEPMDRPPAYGSWV